MAEVTIAPFVDTNVVVYALDASDAAKQVRAQRLLDERPRPRTSPQVLRELYSVSVRKLGMSPDDAHATVEALSPTVAVVEDVGLVLAAIASVRRWQISIWDALIVEAARAAGCARLLSEDLQAGMDFDGVVVENPFASAGDA